MNYKKIDDLNAIATPTGAETIELNTGEKSTVAKQLGFDAVADGKVLVKEGNQVAGKLLFSNMQFLTLSDLDVLNVGIFIPAALNGINLPSGNRIICVLAIGDAIQGVSQTAYCDDGAIFCRYHGFNAIAWTDWKTQDSTIVVDNVTSGSTTSALSANQGRLIHEAMLDINTDFEMIGTSLNSLQSTKADKTEIPAIVDNLTTGSTTSALSANQGKVLREGMLDVANDLEAIGTSLNSLQSTKADKTEIPAIVDNLTSTSATSALSAKQGKSLSETKMNKLTEIPLLNVVPYIDANSGDMHLSGLAISNISSADLDAVKTTAAFCVSQINFDNTTSQDCIFFRQTTADGTTVFDVAISVSTQKKWYRTITMSDEGNTIGNWANLDSSIEIVDNLTSTSATSALSAKQGKALSDNKLDKPVVAPAKAELAYVDDLNHINSSGFVIENLTEEDVDLLDNSRLLTGSVINFDGSGNKECFVLRRDSSNISHCVDFAITYEDEPKIWMRKFQNDDGIITRGAWVCLQNNFVNLTGNQFVGGEKVFTNKINVNLIQAVNENDIISINQGANGEDSRGILGLNGGSFYQGASNGHDFEMDRYISGVDGNSFYEAHKNANGDPTGTKIFGDNGDTLIESNSTDGTNIFKDHENNNCIVLKENKISFNSNINTPVNIDVQPTTWTQTEGGTITTVMPLQGAYYKKVILFFNNITAGPSAGINFPVEFTNIPCPSGTGNTLSKVGSIILVAKNKITFNNNTGDAINGFLILEGF